jgi:hypothetical protein
VVVGKGMLHRNGAGVVAVGVVFVGSRGEVGPVLERMEVEICVGGGGGKGGGDWAGVGEGEGGGKGGGGQFVVREGVVVGGRESESESSSSDRRTVTVVRPSGGC